MNIGHDLSPPSGPVQRRLQGPPAKSKFLGVVFFTLILAVPGSGDDFALLEQDFDDRRISAEAPSQDAAIGIQHFLDPELARAIGARGLKIWIDEGNAGLEEFTYFLRVARSPSYLENTELNVFGLFNANLRQRAQEAAVNSFPHSDEAKEELVAALGEYAPDPTPIGCWDSSLEISKSPWDLLYEGQYRLGEFSAGTPYGSSSMSRLREYLLAWRYGINARFVHGSGSAARVREFVVQAEESLEEKTAKAFIFDSDPFAYRYRLHMRERIPRYLTDRQGCIHYQWIRAAGVNVEYGDIHSIRLPRPLNISVIGDSYTSGEGARLYASRQFGRVVGNGGNRGAIGVSLRGWIGEYGGYPGHRSVNSGWESAVNQTVKARFTDLAINFYNVSSSGAQVRNYDENGPTGEDEIPLHEISERWGDEEKALTNAARQMHAMDAILARDEQETIDVLGFTFGGNDANFSKLIAAILYKDGEDGDYSLENIGKNLDYLSNWGVDFEGGPFWDDDPPANPIVFPVRASFFEMAQDARDRLEWLGLELESGNFGVRTEKVIQGNYPNPVGAADHYCPAVAPCWAAKIDSVEMGWIRRDILPEVNDRIVAANASRFGYSLADTYEELPVMHGHHLGKNFGVRWFEPILTTNAESEIFPYAFHPNARGHFNVYRPVYLEKLNECLDSTYRTDQFAKEQPSFNLALVEPALIYDGPSSTLRLVGQIENPSTITASQPMRVEVRALLEATSGLEAVSEAIPAPVRDVKGSVVELPPLEPRGKSEFSIVLSEGQETAAVNELLLRHFLGVQETEAAKGLIEGSLSPASIARRLAAVSSVSFDFRLVPAAEEERGYYSSCAASFGASTTTDLLESLGWLQERYPEAYEEVVKEGQQLGVSSPELLTHPALREQPQLFRMFDVNPDAGLNRFSPGEKIQLSQLQSVGERIRMTGRVGPLDPKYSFLSVEALADKVTLALPTGSVRFAASRFESIADVLPYDGNPVTMVFHQALSLSRQDEEKGIKREFVAHPARFEVPQVVHGVADYPANGEVIEGGKLQVDLRFRPVDVEGNEQIAGVEFRDPVTGASFGGEIVSPDGVSISRDLGRFLLHSPTARVEVVTFNEEHEQRVGYDYLNVDAPATVRQRYLELRDGELLVEFTISGPGAGDYAQGFEVHISPDAAIAFADNAPAEERFVYTAVPQDLTVKQVDEEQGEVRFVLPIPLDVVHSNMRNVRYVLGEGALSEVRYSSLDLSDLRVNALGVIEPLLRGVELEVLSDREAEVRSEVPGLLMVDTSEDLRTWKRSLTTMVDGAAPFRFDWPRSASGKLFLRSSLMKAK
jgi:hypothetical protein